LKRSLSIFSDLTFDQARKDRTQIVDCRPAAASSQTPLGRMSFRPRQGFDQTVNPLTIALLLPSSGRPAFRLEVAPVKEDKRRRERWIVWSARCTSPTARRLEMGLDVRKEVARFARSKVGSFLHDKGLGRDCARQE
jgi:hypothetical protein